MKIVVARYEHRGVIQEFLLRQERHGEMGVLPEDAHNYLEGQGDGSLLLVTDHVRMGDELRKLYDHPMLGDDMVVGIVTISGNCEAGPEQGYGQCFTRKTHILIAPEYHNEVNLVLVLQDLISTVVMDGLPYKQLMFVQASEGDSGDTVLRAALQSSGIASGYVNEKDGKSGYFTDLRVGHYLWSALNRRKSEEE